MKKLMPNFVLVVVLLIMAMGRPVMGGDSEYARATLKGISGVWVLVESFAESAKNAGFDRRTFQTDMELKLRLAGIQVLTKKEWVAAPGSPYLYLNLNPLSPEERGPNSPYAIDLELKQDIRLVRDPSIEGLGATWSTSGVGYGDIPYIREYVKDHMDKFINAWLSVNQ